MGQGQGLLTKVQSGGGSRMSQYKDCLLAGKSPLNSSVLHYSAAYSSCQLIVPHLINTTSSPLGVILWLLIPQLKRPSGGLIPTLLLMTSPLWGCLISSSPIDEWLVVDWISSPCQAILKSSLLEVSRLASNVGNPTT